MVDALAVFQAFAAGVLSFFAPCSVAMLPAYISYYLGRAPGEAAARSPALEVREPARWVLATGIALAALSLSAYAAPEVKMPLLLATTAVGGLALVVTWGERWTRADTAATATALPVLLGGVLVSFALLDVFRVSSGESRLGPQQLALMVLGTALVLAGGLRASPAQAARGARLGALTSLGILAVFGLLGLPFFGLLRVLDFGAQSALVLLVAAAMVAMGLLGLAGRDVSVALPIRAPRGRDHAAFLAFGVGYGLVALGCNLPLFLFAALGPLVRDADPLSGLLALLAYGAGMALLMVALSVGLAMGRGFTEQRLRAAIPKVKLAGNLVLVAAGLYIAWYDWTVLRLAAP